MTFATRRTETRKKNKKKWTRDPDLPTYFNLLCDSFLYYFCFLFLFFFLNYHDASMIDIFDFNSNPIHLLDPSIRW
ncbi:hypothetical protein BCR41DRAFT_318774 [Lobosporangium transversale]|uniref:Uncharacterized protein n=1 Tax=Lobosporangium transversale TaxID=64571 RepID=A0A1Y2GWS1_9FUNG|nr:hypothetical protein BCR41DRAFT_318774 [Lobosporangium transversale]ORZ26709.1 hypothetical protein BCR41DRAFT_318774 [Lobosporangium transversale]|eukprot:XP_021884472.1 hypothetical protein BCR41DRAFT_318774 [Lobosporangium transversale]